MGGLILYFILISLIPVLASMNVKKTFNKYARVATTSGMTGAEMARRILDANGLHQVKVVEGRGFLSDHYNPLNKTVALSPDNYHGHSVAGAAVAAHEVGHAIQDSQNYSFLRFRHALVPVANLGSNLSWVFIMIGIFSRLSGMFLLGIVLMAAGVLFQLITLPVEFNASSRAMDQIVSLGLIRNEEERHAKKVLNAAAMTYVAAAAVAIIELLRLVLIFTGMQGEE
ncbi:zinc metallopeptidase [Bacillus salacetis]|uniref:Zinc metallopeptidase n=1 Tax=Bacillus salacetis TaxID=2315464 RepID=A0A3A1R2V2_9BACI|nr:zinc metallopeptidase [Bacillus salacetis]RIW33134.1 zinc metallopeptidase [Bacillus salacetis]